MSARNRTPSNIVGYGLYLYFLGLSFRNTAKALSFLLLVKVSHVSIWNGLQKYRPWKHLENKKIKEYIIDETVIKTGSETIWLVVITEPKNKEILAANISKKRNISIVKRFLSHVVNKFGLHAVSSDGGNWYPGACKFLNLHHHLHSAFEKSIVERTMQYIKDRTEWFDDYFPCKKNKCKLKHVKQWLKLFVYQHNQEIMS
ncbi:MAG TPA: DDE-type integrase/transposase/recombinase [Verrucomicrobiae bacterium]|nr:DDE-type integrase/transposase/recombinase [Verrucomicrobiae bacterium]